MAKQGLFGRIKDGVKNLVQKARTALAGGGKKGGGKKADGIWRRTFVANASADMVLNPIWEAEKKSSDVSFLVYGKKEYELW